MTPIDDDLMDDRQDLLEEYADQNQNDPDISTPPTPPDDPPKGAS